MLSSTLPGTTSWHRRLFIYTYSYKQKRDRYEKHFFNLLSLLIWKLLKSCKISFHWSEWWKYTSLLSRWCIWNQREKQYSWTNDRSFCMEVPWGTDYSHRVSPIPYGFHAILFSMQRTTPCQASGRNWRGKEKVKPIRWRLYWASSFCFQHIYFSATN